MYMTRALHAVSVADFESLDPYTITYFDESSSAPLAKRNITTFCESLEGHQAYTPVFVCEVWPNNIVEDVSL